MPAPLAWLAGVATGFVKSLGFALAALIVPLVSAALPLLAAFGLVGTTPWSWTNAWSWGALGVLAAVLTLAAAKPVGLLFRRLIARWSHVTIPNGYRPTAADPEPTLLATGYWWNGYSYERTRRDAEQDQRWRRLVLDPAYWRDVRWVIVAAVVVAPGCAVPTAAATGAVVAFTQPGTIAILIGVLLVIATIVSARYFWQIVAPLAQRCFRPQGNTAITLRVRELEQQRSHLTAVQAAEIRRIERDLHDGAQARLVAVGLSLATAEKLMAVDPDRAKALLREARRGTSESLAELRDLVRGVNPPVLVERGIVDAIRALALDSALAVEVHSPSGFRLEDPIESAVYFSVAELLANVAKYAPAARVDVRLRHTGTALEVEVIDDGRGGAAIAPGGGLDGVRRRVAAFDGTLALASPVGGPTRANIVIPCASS